MIRFLLLTALVSLRAYGQAPFKVVIDPGHGGNDEGTVYLSPTIRLTEKEVTLALARETARSLRAKGFDVILTRSSDKDISLPERTALANRAHADVFLSIHMNSTPSPLLGEAQGIETYILSHATDAASKRLASLENSVLRGSSIEKISQDSDVSLILKDLSLDANLGGSKRLACAIQTNLVNKTSRANRGIKQALFYVLLGADMPSVLVETGFLNSQRDRTLVTTPEGRRAIGAALTRALEQYRLAQRSPDSALALSRCQVH